MRFTIMIRLFTIAELEKVLLKRTRIHSQRTVQEQNNIGTENLNTVNYSRHVNSPMYCSHHINCLACFFVLLGKHILETINFISSHSPQNFAVVPLRVFRAELSFYSVSQKEKRIQSIRLYCTRL
jgi:hypothetical protein